MKTHRIYLSGLVAGFSFFYLSGTVAAQGFFETAVRQSEQNLYGSPKAIGMGGCFMGTGADPSALAYNPAATGLARKSSVQFSLMPFLHNSQSVFRGSEVNSDLAGMPFGSFGLSLANRKDDGSGYLGGVFSVSYNRTQHSSRNVNWEGYTPLFQNGVSTKNSLVDYWMDNLNRPGSFPDDLLFNPQPIFSDNFLNDAVMAYDAYLLDDTPVSDNLFVRKFPQADLEKSGSFSQTMTTGNWNFGYSADFNDRFFLGLSVLYHTSAYTADVSYTERIRNAYPGSSDAAQKYRGAEFTFEKSLEQSSRGIGANLGILYKFSDQLRLSAAIQLPTLTWMTEIYKPSISWNLKAADFPGGSNNIGEDAPFENEFRYKLRLPARYRAGITWIAGKSGMVEAGMEFTNPGASTLYDGDGYNFTRDNPLISQNFGTQVNFRTGGEYRIGDYRLRGGLAYFSSALKSGAPLDLNIPGNQLSLTAGFGARFDLWYWDAAILSSYYSLKNNYLSGYDQDVQTSINNLQLHVGAGFFL